MKTAVLPMEASAPEDLFEPVAIPEIPTELVDRDRIASVQQDATVSEQDRALPGDWLVLRLLIASIPLIVAMNVYDFLRGLLGL